MPGAAIQTGNVDFILPLAEIPSALVSLVVKGDGG
jgi:chemotaxis response regulator CheB